MRTGKCTICGKVFPYDKPGRTPWGCEEHREEAKKVRMKTYNTKYWKTYLKEERKSCHYHIPKWKLEEARFCVGNYEEGIYL